MMNSNTTKSGSDTYDLLVLQMHRLVIRNFCVFYFLLAVIAILPAWFAGDWLTCILNAVASVFYAIPLLIVLRTDHYYLAARLLVIIAMVTLQLNGLVTNMDITVVTLSWYFVFVVFCQLVLNKYWAAGVAVIGVVVTSVFSVLQYFHLNILNPGLDSRNLLLGAPGAMLFSFFAVYHLLGHYRKINSFTLQRLVEADSEKSYLINVMSHDLRNSLAAIKGLTFLTGEAMKTPDAVEIRATSARNNQLIDETASDALQLVDEVVVSSRDLSSAALQIGEYHSLPLLQPLVERYRQMAEKKGVTLVMSGTAQDIPLYVDAGKFSRVVENLLTNAIKFCSRGNRIIVDVQRKYGSAIVSVQDTGIGIPADLQGKIFEPFTSAGRTGTADERSVGLGMSIVKKLVEMHNGSIWIDSTEGQGTTVFVRLPARS